MGTTLTRTGLVRPASGETSWADTVNAWWNRLDVYGGFTDLTATWTALQTFSNINITNGTIAFSKDSTPCQSSGVIYAAASSATNTTSNDFHSFSLSATPANGRVIRVTAAGTYNWTSGTMVYDVRLGGIAGATTPVFTPPGSAGNWHAEAMFYVANSSAARGTLLFNIDDGTATAAKVYGTFQGFSPTLTGTPAIATHITIGSTMSVVEGICVMEMLG